MPGAAVSPGTGVGECFPGEDRKAFSAVAAVTHQGETVSIKLHLWALKFNLPVLM